MDLDGSCILHVARAPPLSEALTALRAPGLWSRKETEPSRPNCKVASWYPTSQRSVRTDGLSRGEQRSRWQECLAARQPPREWDKRTGNLATVRLYLRDVVQPIVGKRLLAVRMPFACLALGAPRLPSQPTPDKSQTL